MNGMLQKQSSLETYSQAPPHKSCYCKICYCGSLL